MSSSIDIRKVKFSELNVVYQLNQDNQPHVSGITLEALEWHHRQAQYFRIAVLDDRQIAGFLIAFTPDSDYESPNFLWFKERYSSFFYIDRIAVSPLFRRQGIAASLYQDLEALAREQGYPLLSCEVNIKPENPVSMKFHNNLGFYEVGTQETEGGSKTVSLQIKNLV